MSIQTILVILSSILFTIGPTIYVVSIIKGQTRPHRMTRFIVLFVLILNFIGILAAKGNLGAEIFGGINCIQALIIFGLSLWKGMGGTNKFDWICLGIALVGVIGWKITGDPLLGIWFSVLADLSAFLPAFVKTYHHPYTESPWYYALSGIAAFLSLVAYKLEPASIFQIYILVCVVIMLGLIYRKKLMKVL